MYYIHTKVVDTLKKKKRYRAEVVSHLRVIDHQSLCKPVGSYGSYFKIMLPNSVTSGP